jgi:hypothetical protein
MTSLLDAFRDALCRIIYAHDAIEDSDIVYAASLLADLESDMAAVIRREEERAA